MRTIRPRPGLNTPTNINEGPTMQHIPRIDRRIDAQSARVNYIDDVVVKHVDAIEKLEDQIDTLEAKINALTDLIDSQGELISGVGEIAALNASGLARVARSGVDEVDPVQACEDAWEEAFGDAAPQYETNIRGGSATAAARRFVGGATRGRYLVSWSMPFDADSAEDAALQAQATLQDPHNTATCFVVEAPEGRKVIDLAEKSEEAP